MPDAGTGGAAAAGGATTSGDGSESSRHRHRAQQGDSERPEPGSAPQQSSSGVLDKLFGKRLLQAGRHILSHKSWMKTVPTENCDVLMTFAGQTLKDAHTDVTTSKVWGFKKANNKNIYLLYKKTDQVFPKE
ncbi:PREDICTED: anoctamin-8-like [Poecilia mexicana]|uniref:anoctamin-8-like n=1 Tax=Poecilia mexicana TaxID=48701 RepID=UPI00072E3524|nr:PREDICTED: anoctamin-8-like [Poecilia mexicana]